MNCHKEVSSSEENRIAGQPQSQLMLKTSDDVVA